MKQIKFTVGGSSSVYGNFAPGDLLRCSEAAARHFVEEAHCAQYVGEPPAEVQPAAQAAEAPAADAQPGQGDLLAAAPAPRTRKPRAAADPTPDTQPPQD